MDNLNSVTSCFKNSFEFYKWSDLKISLLITINSFVKSWQTLLKNFQSLYLFLIFLYSIEYIKDVFKINLNLFFKFFILFIPSIFFFFLILLLSRPSVNIKDNSYLVKNLKKFPSFCLNIILIAFMFVPHLIRNYLCCSFLRLFIFALFVILAPLIITASLFQLDSDGNFGNIFTSIINSFKMVFYYYPLFFSIGLIGLFGYGFFKTIQLPTIIFKKSPYIINILTNFVLGSLEFIILSAASIIFISLITTFYLKIKHANHKLFFK
ncbi:TPA: hypothetical protein DEO28_02855 [Candidatus Dependentiae bacterium]|nr:MAG: hypothetical protein UR14_C0005G0078 [candidate division TM6 bacterium GW2011_GWE2_31_21]KKP53154.1 MAG: hypothetical protein UR43_C0007G0078 [candidate division TM6 bacterium GW2011_GWF2_33_332]HBS47973.1 hypothetical protein [Candidatus Dependentiae bacterium]HBZ73423.1 hypothetical protein [Candidatus Dependentiae bacterium]